MSEQLSQKPERHENVILDPEHEIEAGGQHELPAGEENTAEKLQEARAAAEQAASDTNPVERLQAAEKAAEPLEPARINRELANITRRRELQQIRRRLSAPQRALSSLIHQPAIRTASEAAGKTVSRPSGLLGGGLVAFLGSAGYLYSAQHLGFRYNYLVFILLFAGGFVVGLVLELLVWVAMRRRSTD